jgi:hypothetical protein
MTERELAEALAELLEHGLIEPDEDSDGDRFSPTPAGRAYVDDRLDEASSEPTNG